MVDTLTHSVSQSVSVQYKNNNKNNKINIYIYFIVERNIKRKLKIIFIYAIVIDAFIINII